MRRCISVIFVMLLTVPSVFAFMPVVSHEYRCCQSVGFVNESLRSPDAQQIVRDVYASSNECCAYTESPAACNACINISYADEKFLIPAVLIIPVLGVLLIANAIVRARRGEGFLGRTLSIGALVVLALLVLFVVISISSKLFLAMSG